MKKILIVAGGKKDHLQPFIEAGKKFGVNVKTASFSEVSYNTGNGGSLKVEVLGEDIKSFDVVYIRLVGRRFEELSILVDYARKNSIRLVDGCYQDAVAVRLPYPKSLEIKILFDSKIPVPLTIFGSIEFLKENAPKYFGNSFVIKDTVGKQGHGVWSPKSNEDMDKVFETLVIEETKNTKRFLAQEFIRSSQRTRVLVIGGKAVAAITRPTRWRKRFIQKINNVVPEGLRKGLTPIPQEDAELAERAAQALKVDIAGVDILHDDETGETHVLEVNSAPRWKSIEQDTGVNVEEEILKFLIQK